MLSYIYSTCCYAAMKSVLIKLSFCLSVVCLGAGLFLVAETGIYNPIQINQTSLWFSCLRRLKSGSLKCHQIYYNSLVQPGCSVGGPRTESLFERFSTPIIILYDFIGQSHHAKCKQMLGIYFLQFEGFCLFPVKSATYWWPDILSDISVSTKNVNLYYKNWADVMNTGTTLLIIDRASVLLYVFYVVIVQRHVSFSCVYGWTVWQTWAYKYLPYDSSHDNCWWVNFVLVSQIDNANLIFFISFKYLSDNRPK